MLSLNIFKCEAGLRRQFQRLRFVQETRGRPVDLKRTLSILFLVMSVAMLLPAGTRAQDEFHQITTDEYRIVQDEAGLDRIQMLASGYAVINSPGDPAIPEKVLEFRVEDDIDWSSMEVTVQERTDQLLPSFYDIPPVPPMISDSGTYWGEDKNIVDGRNLYVYEKDAYFPSDVVYVLPYTQKKELIRKDKENGDSTRPAFETVKYLRLAFRPFQYNPVRGEIRVTTKATIRISYRPRSVLKTGRAYPMSNGSISDYVIMTTNATVANSDRLADFVHMKQFQGHTVRVVTETDFDGMTGPPPNGRAEKMRAWLKSQTGVEYVLLVGNPDPDDPADPGDTVGDIPMKMCWPRYFSRDCREAPTDYFYADLSGNWDLDGDGFFGEGLDVNHETSPDPSIDADTFSVRWTGQVMFDFNEEYEFITFSDDGVRLWIDGDLVIDHWTAHAPAGDSVKRVMSSGRKAVRLDFREETGDGIIHLYWKTTVGSEDPHYVPLQIIPSDHLYNDADAVGGLTGKYYNDTGFTEPYALMRTDSIVQFNWGTGDLGSGGPDTGAEVFVGRIPVYNNDYAQLDAILGKLILYETDPEDISWRKSILLPMEPSDGNTPGYHLGEGIRNDYALTAGFKVHRIYDEDYSLQPGKCESGRCFSDPDISCSGDGDCTGGPTPETWPCNEANVLAEWQNGYGMVTWWTHGNETGAADVFSSGSAPGLDDTKPSFTFQASCLNGHPETKNNLQYALLKNGGIATVSATRVSWYAGGPCIFDPHNGFNHNLAYYYTRKVVEAGDTAGVALYLTKGDIPQIGMNEMDYNLYGEPDCALLTTSANYAPVADAGGPYTANEGDAITFDASGSYDPEGDALSYRWDFDNDGTWDTGWSAAATATHTWCDNHTGQVVVEVRDKLGLTNTAQAAVVISNVSPAVNAGPDRSAQEGDTVQFNGGFTDPGCDTWTYSWNFGDGSAEVTGSLTPAHAFGDNGTYTVALTVTDDDGGSGVDTLAVTVSNVAPAVTSIGMDQPNLQFILPVVHTLIFTGDFTDPGWLDTHASLWQFGDGETAGGTLTEENSPPDATGTSTASHAFDSPGTYTLSLTITDDDGGNGTDTMQVTVVDEFGALQDIREYVQSLPETAFNRDADIMRKTLDNKLAAINSMLRARAFQGAIQALVRDIRAKADGAGNDWIVDPVVQQELCMKIDDLTAYLKYLKSI